MNFWPYDPERYLALVSSFFFRFTADQLRKAWH